MTVALKVCEGCGSLFLRTGMEVHCGGCRTLLAGFPGRRTRGWRRRGHAYGVVAVLPTVQAVAATASSTPDAIEWRVVAPQARRLFKREPVADVAFYRKYTEALLRRYLRLTMQCGRAPALLGREVFQGAVSHSAAVDFTDALGFCIDVERLVGRLEPRQRDALGRIALQEHSQGEAAAMMGISLRGMIRLYQDALDALTGLLLEAELLQSFGCGG